MNATVGNMTDFEKVTNSFEESINMLKKHRPCSQTIKAFEELLSILKYETPIAPIARISANTPNHYVCGNCGTKINFDDRYCRKCGYEIDWERVQE
jgi:ribosomal protein L40E